MTARHPGIPPRTPRWLADQITGLAVELAGEIIAALAADLAASRLQSANRLAAIRAALGAADSGESDPLDFLRDQLAEEAAGDGGHGGGR